MYSDRFFQYPRAGATTREQIEMEQTCSYLVLSNRKDNIYFW